MPLPFQVPEFTFERAEPVLCVRYPNFKGIFTPGTILQSLFSEKSSRSYDLCPECWESYNTKYQGEDASPEMKKKIEEIRSRRLPDTATAQSAAPVGRSMASMRNLVIEQGISSAQRGVGPPVRALPPSSTGFGFGSMPVMSGYNTNHQFFSAELAGAARKMPPPIVPVANSNNVTAHISIRHPKMNSTKPVMTTLVFRSISIPLFMKMSSFKILAYNSLYNSYLQFAKDRVQLLLPATLLSFHRGDHIELDDPSRSSSTIAQEFATKAGKTPSNVEAYLRMTTSQHQTLLNALQDVDEEQEYFVVDKNRASTPSSSTSVPLSSTTTETAGLGTASTYVDDELTVAFGVKRPAPNEVPQQRPGKIARTVETYPEYDGSNELNGYRLLDMESLTQAVNLFTNMKLDGVFPTGSVWVDVVYIPKNASISGIISDGTSFDEDILSELTHQEAYLLEDTSATPSYGGFREVRPAKLMLINHNHWEVGHRHADSFSGHVAAKQFYRLSALGVRQHVASNTARTKCLQEFVHQWAVRALWNGGNGIAKHFLAKIPENPAIPDITFLQFGIALPRVPPKPIDKKTPGGWLLEPGVFGSEWKKYISNDSSVIPETDEGDPQRQQLLEYLAFLQHCQFIFSRGLMFLSDYQGHGKWITDLVVIASPRCGQVFSSGNIPLTHSNFPTEHNCKKNRYCSHARLPTPIHHEDYPNPLRNERGGYDSGLDGDGDTVIDTN